MTRPFLVFDVVFQCEVGGLEHGRCLRLPSSSSLAECV